MRDNPPHRLDTVTQDRQTPPSDRTGRSQFHCDSMTAMAGLLLTCCSNMCHAGDPSDVLAIMPLLLSAASSLLSAQGGRIELASSRPNMLGPHTRSTDTAHE